MKRVLYLSFAVVIGLMSSDVFAQRSGGQRPGGQRPGGRAVEPAKTTPVAMIEGVATLSPENTKVNFVGTHVGDEPKPRLGGFNKFKGKLTATEDGTSIKSLIIEFETGSLWTEIGDKLTDHLKNADFLDVEKYPTAKFVSKSIKAGKKKGALIVVGDFTLMENTNEITIPVTMKKTDAGVVIKGNFKLDRVSFGMTKKAEQVSKEVSISLSIGEKTTGAASASSPPRGQVGRRGRDPSAMFKNQDANGDGKLTGDEIPDFFKGRMDAIDANGDKAITLEELQKVIQNRGGRGQGGDR